MKVIGYIRISTSKQDLDNQKHHLLEYAQAQQLVIHEFVHSKVSSRESTKERRVDELLRKLSSGDLLLVTEISRLGRNMLETLNTINQLSENDVSITFVNQIELSTTGAYSKLLLAIYSYFAEAEREYISMRTKQGLAAAKAKGKQLGRPKGSRNKDRTLSPFKEQILTYLQLGLNLEAIRKIINPSLSKPLSYNSYRYFVLSEPVLFNVWQECK